MASAARNVVEGNGFYYQDIAPFQLNDSKFTNFRVPYDYILQASITAVLFKLFGISDIIAILPSILSFFLCTILVYLTAKRLFGEKAAVVSTLLVAINPLILFFSIRGGKELLLILFLLICFFILSKERKTADFALVGMVLGLCWLTTPETIFYVLPFAVFAFFSQGKNKFLNCLMFILSFFIIGLPNLYRFYIYYGNPFFPQHAIGPALTLYMGEFPNYAGIRTLTDISGINLISSFPMAFLDKYFSNMKNFVINFYWLGSPFMMTFFLVGLFKKHEKTQGQLLVLLCSLIAIQILAFSAQSYVIRRIVIFIPFVTIYAVGFVRYVIGKVRFESKNIEWAAILFLFLLLATYNDKASALIIIFFILIGSLTFKKLSLQDNLMKNIVIILTSIYLLKQTVLPIYYNIFGQMDVDTKPRFHYIPSLIKDNTSPREIIISDVPWAVGWYGERKSILLPDSISTLQKLEKKKTVDAVLLTSEDVGFSKGKEWHDLLEEAPETFGGFELIDIYKDNENKVLLYKKKKQDKQ